LIGEQPDGDLRLQPPLFSEPRSRNPSPASVSKYKVDTSKSTRLAGPSPAWAAQATEIFCRQESFAYTGSRRFSVAYDAGVTPASSSTRSESSLLTGSMIRASTKSGTPHYRRSPHPGPRHHGHGTRHRAGSPSAKT